MCGLHFCEQCAVSQGKGRPGDELGGSRQIFNDARKRGRITSDVYVESAMIEYHCYEAEVAQRILERGLKLFPDDEAFALEYIRHLVRTNDQTSKSKNRIRVILNSLTYPRCQGYFRENRPTPT